VYVVSVDGYKRRDQKGRKHWYHSEIVPADAEEYGLYKYVRGIAVAMLECQVWTPFIVQAQHLVGDYDTYMAERTAYFAERQALDERLRQQQRDNEERNSARFAQIKDRLKKLYGELGSVYADRTHEEDFLVKLPGRTVEVLLGLETQ